MTKWMSLLKFNPKPLKLWMGDKNPKPSGFPWRKAWSVQGDSLFPVFRDKQQPGTCRQALAPDMGLTASVLRPPCLARGSLRALLGDPELHPKCKAVGEAAGSLQHGSSPGKWSASSAEQTRQSTEQSSGKGTSGPRCIQRAASPCRVVMEVVRSRTMSFRLFNLTFLLVQIEIKLKS